MEIKEKIIKIDVDTKEGLDKLYNCSALTFIGLESTDENLEQLVNWIRKYSEISDPLNIYIIQGNVMNREYGLTESNAYKNDLSIVSIDLNDIKDVKKITIPRFEIGGRWFDDIVNNNMFRQEEIDGVEEF